MTSFRLLKPGFTSTFITLFMILQISACSTEEFKEASTNGNNLNTPVAPGSNQPALITGTDTGSVTENNDPDNNNLLEVSGKLNITDGDTGEAAFTGSTEHGNYGNLTIDTAGNWSYAANNSQQTIQTLTNRDSLKENLTISSIDGTAHTIVITIFGTGEPVADISLTWVAPSEREDNTGILLSEIAGYKIYYGSSQDFYSGSVDINDRSTAGYTFRNFSAGTYYFVITTLDTNGQESPFSSEIQLII